MFLFIIPSLLLALLLLSNLWIELIISSKNSLRFGVCWGHTSYRISIPIYRFKQKFLLIENIGNTDYFCRGRELLKAGRPLLFFVRSLFFHCSLDIRGVVTIGTGDAATTGIAAGTMWQIIGWAQALLAAMFKNQAIKVRIEPQFNTPVFSADIRCILFLPLLHIITAAMKI